MFTRLSLTKHQVNIHYLLKNIGVCLIHKKSICYGIGSTKKFNSIEYFINDFSLVIKLPHIAEKYSIPANNLLFLSNKSLFLIYEFLHFRILIQGPAIYVIVNCIFISYNIENI